MIELFLDCIEAEYQTAGTDVNYAFRENGDTLYIYWQWSNSLTDWILNFWFTEKVYKMFKVHKGFYYAYSQARDIILDKVCEKDKNGFYKWQKIIIVGYSHGGALTQISFEDIVYHRNDISNKIFGFAFESPRCLKVPKKYRSIWKNMFVIRTNNDLITHLPPRLFGYTDLGQMIKTKGDTSLVKNHLPKCIKSHYPRVVLSGLENLAHNAQNGN